MTGFTKRGFLGIGAVALAGAWVASFRPAESYETIALSVDRMKADGAMIVDIRGPDEWAATGVIDGARLVTFTDPESFLAALGAELADGRDLVLVCQSGRRSASAAEQLAGQISNRVISAKGGMASVIGSGYKTVVPN